jgi:hypothetical protein
MSNRIKVRKQDCLHCKITKQAKLHYERGLYSREDIIDNLLCVLADFVANISEFVDNINGIADVFSSVLARKLQERALLMQRPAGSA